VRQRHVNWFRDEYQRVVQNDSNRRPSIIAHSFGTYIVARALEQFPEIKFHRIILCGSIVRRDYPWSKILDRGQAECVLNDYGAKDWVVAVAPCFANDVGPSGKVGFEDHAGGRLHQRGHEEFSHSDYFYSLNYQQLWIPFLRGMDPAPLPPLGKSSPNWKFRVTVFVSAVVLLLLAGWWFVKSNGDDNQPPVSAFSRESRPAWLDQIQTRIESPAGSSKAPLDTPITIRLEGAPANARIDWSQPVNGELNPTHGPTVTYVGKRLGWESLSPTIVANGERVVCNPIPFQVVRRFVIDDP
jgi:pimeloyl-ACP methyl ester carboxylesterase